MSTNDMSMRMKGYPVRAVTSVMTQISLNIQDCCKPRNFANNESLKLRKKLGTPTLRELLSSVL